MMFICERYCRVTVAAPRHAPLARRATSNITANKVTIISANAQTFYPHKLKILRKCARQYVFSRPDARPKPSVFKHGTGLTKSADCAKGRQKRLLLGKRG